MSVRACGAGVVIILSCVGEREGRAQARQRVGQQDIVTFFDFKFYLPPRFMVGSKLLFVLVSCSVPASVRE